MHPLLQGSIGVALIGGFVQFVLFIRWLYRRSRNNEIERVFVSDMATNHLPHIYDALWKICRANGIELGVPPPIRWMDFREHD